MRFPEDEEETGGNSTPENGSQPVNLAWGPPYTLTGNRATEKACFPQAGPSTDSPRETEIGKDVAMEEGEQLPGCFWKLLESRSPSSGQGPAL